MENSVDQDFFHVKFTAENDEPTVTNLDCFKYENNILDTYAQSDNCYHKLLEYTVFQCP